MDGVEFRAESAQSELLRRRGDARFVACGEVVDKRETLGLWQLNALDWQIVESN